MESLYARIVIDLPHPSLDRPFDYSVPAELADKVFPGVRVTVPFGLKNKIIDGYCLSVSSCTDCPLSKLKSVASVYEDEFVLMQKLIPVVEWMRYEYHCTYLEAIRCFIPPFAKKIKSPKYVDIVTLTASKSAVSDFIASNGKRAPVMVKVLMLLMDQPELAKEDIILSTWASSQTFTSLKQKGFISIRKEEIYREADSQITPNTKRVTLSSQQIECIEAAKAEYGKKDKRPLLIRGVTGSGKTEVYMHITEYMLSLGKSVIMLIPEIALTPQTVANFRGRFGDDIAILNSRLSNGERYDEWRRIKNGDARVVIGARSAVFAPVRDLGAVLIDEEHEDSYKSESSPRYNAFDIARMRCCIDDAILVMGSATPDVVHYHKAQTGEFIKLVMDKRTGVGFPDITVCDMRREIEMGNRTMFGKPLVESLDAIARSQDDQGILLLNRRGYAEHVSCRSCGYVYKCKHCNVSLTYHKNSNILKCHYCGYAQYMDTKCPACSSKYIKAFGRGTQKLEDEITKLFPDITVSRMDADTTATKGAHHRLLKSFGENKFKLLVGTQMVAKGLDFENVVLVGLVAPDMTLNMPEYKSAERVFRLISQASGRAGRGKKQGKVIVQSYEPMHYAVQSAVNNDYDAFWEKEIETRKKNYYPPFSRMARLLFTSHQELTAKNEAESAVDIIKRHMESFEATSVTVSPAPIERISDKFRWHVVVKYDPVDEAAHAALHEAVDEVLDNNEFSLVQVAVDLSPVSLL